MSDAEQETRFSFGGPCPPLKSWFFPDDPSEKPKEIEEANEQEDPAQPA